MQFINTEADPTKPFSISFQRGVLRPNEFLRRIRDRALDILYEAYRRASNLSERLKIVQALDGAVPHIAPSFQVSAEDPSLAGARLPEDSPLLLRSGRP